MQKVKVQRCIGSGNYDQISLWSKDSIKLHAHSLNKYDPIITNAGYGVKYCFYEDEVIGIGPNKFIRHKPFKMSQITAIDFSGSNVHTAMNEDGEILACLYGQNKLLHYADGNIDYIKISDSEYKYIGVIYTGDIWIAVSATHIYYTSNLSKGFDSIRFTTDDTAYTTCRFNEVAVSQPEGYNQYILYGYNSVGLKLTVTGSTISYTTITQDANRIKLDSIYTPYGFYKIFFVKNNSDNSITASIEDCSVVIQNISCTEFNKIAAYWCGVNIVSMLAIDDNAKTINCYIINFNSLTYKLVQQLPLKHKGSEIYGYDNGDYYSAYVYCSGYNDTTILATRNGINWWHNWGYMYKENINLTRFPITTAIESINSMPESVKGVYIGDGTLNKVSIDIDFDPSKIDIICKGYATTKIGVKEYDTIIDKFGDTWRYCNIVQELDDSQITQDRIYVLNCDFESNTVYKTQILKIDQPQYSSQDSYRRYFGTCAWDGQNITITPSSTTVKDSEVNVEGYYYTWTAIGQG